MTKLQSGLANKKYMTYDKHPPQRLIYGIRCLAAAIACIICGMALGLLAIVGAVYAFDPEVFLEGEIARNLLTSLVLFIVACAIAAIVSPIRLMEDFRDYICRDSRNWITK